MSGSDGIAQTNITGFYSSFVAGMRVHANYLMDLPSKGFSDCDVYVSFRDEELHDVASSYSEEWLQVPSLSKSIILLRHDGIEARVRPGQWNPVSCATDIRRLVPFASALQRKVMLHASGNIFAGSVICFIAESGSGKSTLAAMMETLGYVAVADDLLPCRQQDGRIIIPVWLEERVVFRDLALILFLSRDAHIRRVRLDSLSPKICLHLLLHNGFGEVGGSASWQAQFDVYGLLASRIPAYRLIIPDDLARSAATAKELSFLLACEMETVD